jgi:hypothetical protein
MNRKSWVFMAVMGAILACTGSASAQTPLPGQDADSPQGPRMHGRGPGFADHFEFLGLAGEGGPKGIKGAPFSATAVTETTNSLQDGTHIRRSTQAAIFRDTAGRTRREMSFRGLGPLAASGPGRSFVVIRDPVAGAGYFLEADTKSARKIPAHGFRGMRRGGDRFAGWREKMLVTGELKSESLGTQTVEGVSAVGTRFTRVIPAGQIGNDKPISQVTEYWYSKELQELVALKRSDPRFGTTTYRLTNIKRQEPAAALFQVPADYTVKEGPGPGHRGRHAEAPPPPPGTEDKE